MMIRMIRAVLPIIAALASCLMVTTSVDVLANLNNPNILKGIDFDRLIAGDIEVIWSAPIFWDRFPGSFRSFTALIVTPRLLMAGSLYTVLIYFFAIRRKMSWTVVAWLCLASALIPHLICRLYLWNNAAPMVSGAWVAFALRGQLYASLACAVCPTIELSPPLPREIGLKLRKSPASRSTT